MVVQRVGTQIYTKIRVKHSICTTTYIVTTRGRRELSCYYRHSKLHTTACKGLDNSLCTNIVIKLCIELNSSV